MDRLRGAAVAGQKPDVPDKHLAVYFAHPVQARSTDSAGRFREGWVSAAARAATWTAAGTTAVTGTASARQRSAACAQRSATGPFDDIEDHVLTHTGGGLSQWERKAALETLLCPAYGIQPNSEGGYGQHPAKAMLDAGVRRILITTWRYRTPATITV